MSQDCKCAHVVQKKGPEGEYLPVKVGKPKCVFCHGSGRVVTCAYCDGCGMVNSQICSRCDGHGKVTAAA